MIILTDPQKFSPLKVSSYTVYFLRCLLEYTMSCKWLVLYGNKLLNLRGMDKKIRLTLTLFFFCEWQVICYPSSSEVSTILSELTEQLYFFTADRDSQMMNGHRVITSPPSKELSTAPVWTLCFPNDTERIISTVLKSPNGKICPLTYNKCPQVHSHLLRVIHTEL